MSGQGKQKSALAAEQRQLAWDLVKGREGFTAVDIANETGMSAEWARKVIREWEDAGQISADGKLPLDGKGTPATIWCATAAASEPAESEFARESRRPEFAMWRTMRNVRRFTAADIYLTANTDQTPMTVADIQKYCSTLAEAGYLKVAVKGQVGKRAPVYAMVGRPGPFPPRLMRVPAIYDPNEGAFKVLEKRVRT